MGLEPTTFAVTERAWKPLQPVLRGKKPLLYAGCRWSEGKFEGKIWRRKDQLNPRAVSGAIPKMRDSTRVQKM